MNISKIITHASIFHADEVMAIALLKFYGFTCEIERKFEVTEEEFANEEIFVLDVGKNYDPSKGNFDHHQDQSLPATNVLVADWLLWNKFMSPGVRKNLNSFLTYISDVDKGAIPNGGPVIGVNSIIRSLNSVFYTDFNKVIDFALIIIDAQIITAEKAVEDEERWKTYPRINHIVIQDDKIQMVGWKQLAKDEGIKFLVCPNSKGGYQIISRDNDEFVIPEDFRQTFRHNSGFMAVYPNKETAIEHALEI